RRRANSFAELAAISEGRPVTLTGAGEPERLVAARVTASFFPVFAVRPAGGRGFAESEENSPVAVLGYELWQRRFASDPEIAGKSIVLDGRAHTVAGVMPRGFAYAEHQDLWLPLAVESMQRWGRRAHVLDVVGRLRPEAATAQASAEMRAVADGI